MNENVVIEDQKLNRIVKRIIQLENENVKTREYNDEDIKKKIEKIIEEEITMPKMKTRRSAAKRFKATATGEFKRGKAFRSHILEHKSPTRKRNLRKAALVHKTDKEHVAKMLPYA